MKSTTQRSHPARRRTLAERLESRWLFSAAMINISPFVSTIRLPEQGDAVLAVDHSGTVWAALNDRIGPLFGYNWSPTYQVAPTDSNNTPAISSNIVFTADNSAWFAVSDAAGSRLEQLPAGGPIQDVLTGQAQPLANLTVNNNVLWFTEGSSIGHLTAAGQSQLLDVADVSSFSGLTPGLNGDLWFAATSYSGQGMVGRVSQQGDVRTYTLAGVPSSISAGADGSLYVGSADALWHVAVNGDVTRIPLAGIQPRALTVAPDGALWFIDGHHPDHPISRYGADGALVQFATGVQDQPVPGSLVVAPGGHTWFAYRGTDVAAVATLNVLIGNIDSNAQTDAITLSFSSGTLVVQPDSVTFSGSAHPSDNTDAAPPVPTQAAETTADSAASDEKPTQHVRRADAQRAHGTSAAEVASTPGSAPVLPVTPMLGNSQPADDPAVFEGEFSVGRYAPPRKRPGPPPASRDDGYASHAQERPASTELVLAIPETHDRVELKDAAPLYALAAAPIPPAPRMDQGLEDRPQARTGNVRIAVAAVISDKVDSKNTSQPAGALARWLKLTAYMSAASGLHMWRFGSSSRNNG